MSGVLAPARKGGKWIAWADDREVATAVAILHGGEPEPVLSSTTERWRVRTTTSTIPIRIAGRANVLVGYVGDHATPTLEIHCTLVGDDRRDVWAFRAVGTRWERLGDELFMRWDEEVGEDRDGAVCADLEIKAVRAKMPDGSVNLIAQPFITEVRRAGRNRKEST